MFLSHSNHGSTWRELALPRKERHAVSLVPPEEELASGSENPGDLGDSGQHKGSGGSNEGKDPQVRAVVVWEEVLDQAGHGRFP